MKGANLPVAPVALRFAPKPLKAAKSLGFRAATGANLASHPTFAPTVALHPAESRRNPGLLSRAACDGRRTQGSHPRSHRGSPLPDTPHSAGLVALADRIEL